ncbi:Protein FLUORESCENT IN BLUE LIGHT chloroplastic [Euphorbia peplus]|nr:Protein FLUORESCENT IN BLUE LIGHT chloroplastic [Euphorbia peplus]
MAMAGIIRCSPPSDHIISGKLGKLDSVMFRVDKFSSPLGDGDASIALSSLFRSKCTRDKTLHSICQIGARKLIMHGNFFPKLAAHQDKLKLRSSAITFLLTNALMWNTPFEALAETTCEVDTNFLNMPLLLLVALVGATVGGLLARQRKGELKRLNEQLRQINAALRRQAKIESYAPSLSYAPVGSRVQDEVIVDPRKQELMTRLKTGKNFLRIQDPEKAYEEFKAALELAQALKDHTAEKKAARGLGASLQRQGKYYEAIKYHSMVLAISERQGMDSGNTEAYGAIADCYTELGDLERAGKFYDQYIARLETD